MAKFKLKRFFPQEIEIEITDKQLVQMFPIEVQEHPFMGEISRQWQSNEQIFSVESAKPEELIDMSTNSKHIQLKKETMEKILSSLNKFKIVLYYEDKEDIYEVEKIQ
ncbi:hypothetical protein [Hydrogenivirga sp. 128-5-R1-1]|uniref:hypothetical protein n=1 Tax=Hydrogenivirga sp. 128-5-R1-1 TaxID=392423 RepID=UPI00015F0396|nr:hypothetical protein [Hydrogenivirga sp. 128-5-R1-1]EDP74329.1 hypothetical protein HG1285_04558 [Hydrogenivirga sp. 128-5-R1-1]